jgi:hypothetical protein
MEQLTPCTCNDSMQAASQLVSLTTRMFNIGQGLHFVVVVMAQPTSKQICVVKRRRASDSNKAATAAAADDDDHSAVLARPS